jgi:CheY-like chemotaxis protein
MREDNIVVLIVDDIEDNRLVLKTICKKINNLEIYEAKNGKEAVELTEEKKPDIVLMDIMMPVMDGFEATTIIKNMQNPPYVLIITAANDEGTQDKFIKLGIDGYIRKPIDKEILTNKIEALKNAVLIKTGSKSGLSAKKPLSKQATSCRNFKTYFLVENEEDAMNMGLWLTDYRHAFEKAVTFEFEDSLNAIYKICKLSLKKSSSITAVVEEDFENIYITFIFTTSIECGEIENVITKNIATNILCESTIVYLKIKMMGEINSNIITASKEKIVISNEEIKILRRSHTDKISAEVYAKELSEDGLIDEIHDLKDIETAWADRLSELKHYTGIQQMQALADGAIAEYAKTVNKMHEFSSIGYALASLCSFLKTIEEPKLKEILPKLSILLEHVLGDLSNWRNTVFVSKNTADIHYLDSSLLSSCMQIDALVSQRIADSHDDDDLELF